MPGTTEQYPNWRRKLPLELERWPGDERFSALCAAIAAQRPPWEAQRPKAAAREVPAAGIPRATYRLQLHAGFSFRAATALVPYLAALGVSHVYCSPYLRARPGSTHGYDIIDHNALNPEIGSAEDFEQFVRALQAHGMGQILDLVPNHMGVMGADNRWWMDVLENGPASVYADYFDIDWEPVNPALHRKVLLPVLGDHYGSRSSAATSSSASSRTPAASRCSISSTASRSLHASIRAFSSARCERCRRRRSTPPRAPSSRA